MRSEKKLRTDRWLESDRVGGSKDIRWNERIPIWDWHRWTSHCWHHESHSMKCALVFAKNTVTRRPCHWNRITTRTLPVTVHKKEVSLCMSVNCLHASGVTKTMSVVYKFFDRERHPKSGRWILSTRTGKFGNVFANDEVRKQKRKIRTEETQ